MNNDKKNTISKGDIEYITSIENDNEMNEVEKKTEIQEYLKNKVYDYSIEQSIKISNHIKARIISILEKDVGQKREKIFQIYLDELKNNENTFPQSILNKLSKDEIIELCRDYNRWKDLIPTLDEAAINVYLFYCNSELPEDVSYIILKRILDFHEELSLSPEISKLLQKSHDSGIINANEWLRGYIENAKNKSILMINIIQSVEHINASLFYYEDLLGLFNKCILIGEEGNITNYLVSNFYENIQKENYADKFLLWLSEASTVENNIASVKDACKSIISDSKLIEASFKSLKTLYSLCYDSINLDEKEKTSLTSRTTNYFYTNINKDSKDSFVYEFLSWLNEENKKNQNLSDVITSIISDIRFEKIGFETQITLCSEDNLRRAIIASDSFKKILNTDGTNKFSVDTTYSENSMKSDKNVVKEVNDILFEYYPKKDKLNEEVNKWENEIIGYYDNNPITYTANGESVVLPLKYVEFIKLCKEKKWSKE